MWHLCSRKDAWLEIEHRSFWYSFWYFVMISHYKHEQVWANIEKDLIWESNYVKVLGILIGRNLKFDKYVQNLCSKANRRLSALSGIVKLLSFNKRRILFKAIVESQFQYCPIVWMFIVDITKTKLIGYMREPLELFMMWTSQLLINYLPWINLSVFTIKISRTS